MKVFSREKFIEVHGNKIYESCKGWVDICDGKKVVDERCEGYSISDMWCIDIPDQQKECGRLMRWTMDDFKTKKIAVRVGQKHVREFLQMCEDEGLWWHNGKKPTEFVPSFFGDDLSIAVDSESAKGKLMCSTAKYYRLGMNIEVVDFEDFAGIQLKYRITIESDGKDTKAVMEVNGRQVKEVVAKLHPNDKFSWRTGAALAFDRLWQKEDKHRDDGCTPDFRVGDRVVYVGIYEERFIGKHGTILAIDDEGDAWVKFDDNTHGNSSGRERVFENCYFVWVKDLKHENVVREVKRPAKVGEYIKITNARLACCYKNGDVLKVTAIDDFGKGVYAERVVYIYHKEYVVLEGYNPGK